MKNSVEIVEVGPRDGLQNEPALFPTPKKIELISRLVAAGVRRLEVASFVHPKLVPQMADAEAVVAGLPVAKDVTCIGLVLNEKGFVRALATRKNGYGIREIGCVAVASDSFGEKNQGQTSAESVKISKEIIRKARAEGLSAQVTLSASFGCPFEGLMPVEKVIRIVRELAEAEPKEISIADTIGAAVPSHVAEVFGKAREAAPGIRLR
ncbi:MAG TPA: hydroxymethylglutaryl-CoA lyase, partial [Sphingomonadales bacterium]|nr:hydroxymethylglutaryl-CoA lyase [Sphingomonadales bacterium]